jgi:23S rRNA pseudouridine2457 synthase
VVALWKPMNVLSRFTADGSAHGTLARYRLPAGVHPVGRLDADSEGLLLLSSDAAFTSAVLGHGAGGRSTPVPKTYLAQVERTPDEVALARLRAGAIVLDGAPLLPARARLVAEPPLPPRDPPIRHRLSVPTAWVELVLVEGKNRQVRRMTAAVGHPTLRLVRTAVGGLDLGGLSPGGWRWLDDADVDRVLRGGGRQDRWPS